MAIFEYIDSLNTPYDIYFFDTGRFTLPIRAHWHHYMEILYVMKGSLRVEYDHHVSILKQDDMIVIYPTLVHSIYAADDNYVCYGVVKFNPGTLHFSTDYSQTLRALFSYTSPPNELFVHFLADQLAPYQTRLLITGLVEELEKKNFGYNVTIDALLNLLLVSLARIWQASGIDLLAASSEGSRNSLNGILEYIDSHAGEPLSVQDLAARCNMSYSTFSRLFKQQTGRGCKEYIEHIRICKAQNLLLFTDYSLDYIAAETGFTDCSHFIKTYKKSKGITPAQQRKIGFQNPPGSTASEESAVSSETESSAGPVASPDSTVS